MAWKIQAGLLYNLQLLSIYNENVCTLRKKNILYYVLPDTLNFQYFTKSCSVYCHVLLSTALLSFLPSMVRTLKT